MRVTIPDFALYSWESQERQYPETGPAGFDYRRESAAGHPVDCLLWRDEDGFLLGILNHYPEDVPPWESAGNVNVWIHPDRQREGIGTRLLREAETRWGPIDWEQQRYTRAGLELVKKHREARTP